MRPARWWRPGTNRGRRSEPRPARRLVRLVPGLHVHRHPGGLARCPQGLQRQVDPTGVVPGLCRIGGVRHGRRPADARADGKGDLRHQAVGPGLPELAQERVPRGRTRGVGGGGRARRPVEGAAGVVGDEEPDAPTRAEHLRGELAPGRRGRGGQVVTRDPESRCRGRSLRLRPPCRAGPRNGMSAPGDRGRSQRSGRDQRQKQTPAADHCTGRAPAAARVAVGTEHHDVLDPTRAARCPSSAQINRHGSHSWVRPSLR